MKQVTEIVKFWMGGTGGKVADELKAFRSEVTVHVGADWNKQDILGTENFPTVRIFGTFGEGRAAAQDRAL